MTPIARIAIRTDGHLILGKAFTSDLKPGHVYELRRAVMTDDIVLHDLGLSALTAEASDPEAIAVTAWCSLFSELVWFNDLWPARCIYVGGLGGDEFWLANKIGRAFTFL